MSNIRSVDTAAKPVSEPRQDAGRGIATELIKGVRIALAVRLGEAKMTVDEMMALKAGSVVALETALADAVELYLNDVLVARGEIVAVGDRFGVRIVEIVGAP